ncbi:hypothetical protein BJX70DRAFT_334763 [Aspergillus crustosus]
MIDKPHTTKRHICSFSQRHNESKSHRRSNFTSSAERDQGWAQACMESLTRSYLGAVGTDADKSP